MAEADAVHFGVKIGADSFPRFTEQAKLAERLGFDGFWVGASGRGHDPIALLTHVASVTSSLKVGTAVLLLPLHDPAEIARQVATLDQISGGRVIFGVGSGGERAPDFTIHGIDRKTRGRRMDEALGIIRALWRGEEVHHAGRYYNVEGALQVRPVQQHVPVWIGGRGGVSPIQRRVYERVVNSAEGWMPYIMSSSTYARGQQSIRELSGGREPTWAFTAHANVGGGDGSGAFDYAARQQAGTHGGAGPSPEALARTGAYVIAGNAQMCIDRLNQYVDLGVSEIVFNWACPPGTEDTQMRMLADEVLPAVREHAAARSSVTA